MLSNLRGYHDCCKEWRVYPDRDSELFIPNLISILEKREPVYLYHEDIAWWCMNNPREKIDQRYHDCDISFPGIVAEGVCNPYNKRYRMVDGSHRMTKMKLETDLEASFFYVITPQEFFSLLEDVK